MGKKSLLVMHNTTNWEPCNSKQKHKCMSTQANITQSHDNVLANDMNCTITTWNLVQVLVHLNISNIVYVRMKDKRPQWLHIWWSWIHHLLNNYNMIYNWFLVRMLKNSSYHFLSLLDFHTHWGIKAWIRCQSPGHHTKALNMKN